MDSQIEANIARNIKEMRLEIGMKQSELGEKISYSDKTISKWENGSSVPDITALCAVAELFNVKVDDLVKENAVEILRRKSEPQKPKNDSNDIAMLCLSVLSVFTIAVIIYVGFMIIKSEKIWQVFVWAVPVSAFVCLKYNKVHGNTKWINTVLLSLIDWGLIVSSYLQLISYNLWPIFFIGIPLQAMIIISTLFQSDGKKRSFISLSIFKAQDERDDKND